MMTTTRSASPQFLPKTVSGKALVSAKPRAITAIRELFKKFQTLIRFSQHQVMNPIIKIDGDRATGIWYFFGPFTFYKNNQAKWLAARYEDDYVKVNGEWKIQHLRARGRMSTNYEESWADND